MNLLTPEQLARWRGLPLACVGTPEGAWSHRFTPATMGLSLVDTGTMTTRLSVNGRHEEFDLRAGSIGLFSPYMEVKVAQAGAHQARRILLELDWGGPLCRRLFDDDLISAVLRPGSHFEDPVLPPVLRSMVREISAGCPNGTLFAESLSIGIAAHLGRTRGIRSAIKERGRLSTAQMARVNDLIDCDLGSDLSLRALSEAVGLSKPHFVRLFRNTTGTSPHRYVVQKRMDRAVQLLGLPGGSLADIALDVGFASQSHMTRTFRDLIGTTPGELQKQLTGKKSS
ncbi:helix-turn-helix domain-containing protein [Hydrogenophaga sp. UC242_50]|uniref:helix-turn-helix domain-containing protein n=1 Tax=unclassified Hydrogenophaga TaxID=2610897 RepID=UPI0036D35781